MEVLTVVSLITSVAGILTKSSGAVPADMIKSVLEKLVANKILKWSDQKVADTAAKATAIETAVKDARSWVQWLRGRLSVPDSDVVDQPLAELLKTLCMGSPYGSKNGGIESRARYRNELGQVNWKNVPAAMKAEIGDPGRWLRIFIDESKVELPTTGFGQAPRDRAIDRLQIAFNKWQDCIGVRVRFVKKEEAANVIVKVLELDGQGGKLAEATVGPGPGGSVVSDLFIDRSEVWTPDKFQATICHEIGHLLGLEHINSPDALMFDTLQYVGNLPKFIEAQPLDITVAEQKWGPPIP